MPLSVLVVDDDPVFRDVARRILVAGGFVVVGEAATASEAAATAIELRPDALLVDVGLPDGDGTTLAATLVAMPWRPRVLLTSTDPDAIGAEALRHSGASGFLPKQDLPEASLTKLFMAG
jgi:DNA-binding NarL/FixJ family response regulator